MGDRGQQERSRKRAEDKTPEQQFLDASREWRRLFAEAWGTFLLVLVAAGAPTVDAVSGGKVTEPIAAIAPGLMVMAIIYAMGSVSGAHVNPAVTYAFALRGNFPWRRVPGYLAAQFVGGIAAAYCIYKVFGAAEPGATLPKHVTNLQALLIEILLTAGLVNVILGTASGARNVGTNAGIAVGGYIALAGMWAAPVSGASMNLARSVGPDLVRGNLSTTWIYIVGPLVGATIGMGFEWILMGPPTSHGTRSAQGEGTDR